MEDKTAMTNDKVLIIGLMLALFAAASVKAAETAAPDSVKHRVLEFNLEGVTDKGAKKWDVKGESAEAVSESEVKLDHIVANAYGEEAQATITADKGVYDKVNNNVRLEENVKATIENTKDFTGDISSFGGEVLSSGKAAPVEKKQKKTKTVITCDGEVLFDYEHNYAYFDKNVKVVSDEGYIDADKITVNLDSATKKISQIVADGNVIIKRGENITYSEKATYIDADKKVILTGRPKIVMYQEGTLEENVLSKK